MNFAAMEENLEHFNPRSYAGVTLNAKLMALSGHTAMEISKRLGMHFVGALEIWRQAQDHKAQFAEWLRRSA